MSPLGAQKGRRDAARNRERLLSAARTVFAQRGPDVALEEVAQEAKVSRATLYRNFSTREELASAAFEQNVDDIEARTAELQADPAGIVKLFDFVLDMQFANRGLGRILHGSQDEWFSHLAARTAASFELLLSAGVERGLVQSGVDTTDIMLAFQMVESSLTLITGERGEELNDRIRTLLYRALFT